MQTQRYLIAILIGAASLAFSISIFSIASDGMSLYGPRDVRRFLVFFCFAQLLLLAHKWFREQGRWRPLSLGALVFVLLAGEARIQASEAASISGAIDRQAYALYPDLPCLCLRQRSYYLFDFWLLQRSFDGESWNKGFTSDRWPARLHMSTDLLNSDILSGLQRDQAHKLLGPPDLPVSGDPSHPEATRLEAYRLVYVAPWTHFIAVEYAGDRVISAYRSLVHYF